MEKKRVFSKSLLLLAITSIMLFAMSITSMAATETNMNIQQTNAGDSYVEIKWQKYLGQDIHYHVELSYDGVNWAMQDWNTSPSITIDNLSPDSTYYVRVAVYNSYWHKKDASEDGVCVAVSTKQVICTKPSQVQNLKQTKATKNSISMTWDAVAGASSYKILIFENYDYKTVATSKTNSVTIKGLDASSNIEYYVAAVKNVNGYEAVGDRSKSVDMKTVPKKVTRVAITDLYDNIKVCYYGWTSCENADGYQYEITSLKGKKKYYKATTTSTSARLTTYPVGAFTKARVRAYVEINGKKTYGPWSNYDYNACSKDVTARRSKNGKKITLKWKKVSGVSEYRIYISTKEKKGYKKVATVSSKKSSYTITKYNKKNLKKGQKYYVQLRYVGKNGKKKVVSNIYSYVRL
ncbi:MAG: fibronectin type III domain-containing protein [Coprococcus sp.]|nr:fibronectin type III domain-containing protein [Coprococcus sp.]